MIFKQIKSQAHRLAFSMADFFCQSFSKKNLMSINWGGIIIKKKFIESSNLVHHIFQKHIKMEMHSFFITKKAKQNKQKTPVQLRKPN